MQHFSCQQHRIFTSHPVKRANWNLETKLSGMKLYVKCLHPTVSSRCDIDSFAVHALSKKWLMYGAWQRVESFRFAAFTSHSTVNFGIFQRKKKLWIGQLKVYQAKMLLHLQNVGGCQPIEFVSVKFRSSIVHRNAINSVIRIVKSPVASRYFSSIDWLLKSEAKSNYIRLRSADFADLE